MSGLLIYIWIITLFIDNLLPLVLAGFYPNYKHKEMALSVLGSRQSPVKWIYNVWCILSGVVFCIAPYALYQANSGGLTIAIWILLGLYGLGCEIISGFCPLNENRQEEDTITQIHGGASAIGYKTKLLSTANATPDLIYDGKSFYHGFCNDLQNAKTEILIVSPFMRKSPITSIMKTLSTIIESGGSVTVVTGPPEDFKEKDRDTVTECVEKLQANGVTVNYKSDFYQKFTFIDQSVVWYGSVNFLSFGTHEESIMRF